jgi:L-threonylcarbamoyladenylate synthase
MAIIGQDISRAKQLLEKGELVAIPTETVYGLAANALSDVAVTRIFETKARPYFDPIIVHVASIESARQFVKEMPAQAEQLAAHFWPGPLTLLLKKKEIVPDLVTAGLDRVGIRCPKHPLTQALMVLLPFPLAAPSANPFGYVSPTTAQHVQQQLGEKIAYILDGGPCQVGVESTIVGWEGTQAVVYRLGGISVENIESIIGPVLIQPHSTSQPQAPGQLSSHYAPRKQIYVGDISSLISTLGSIRTGILTFKEKSIAGIPHYLHLVLSPSGDLNEAARNLFSMLRKFDDMNIDRVLAEEVPDEGLGRAINDRLRRAAASR